ncbi:monovalent cation/H+ antiporter subunit D family protein [Pyrococcus horikoshii]|uniref:NADH:quinone oxidoreductase/Mrp antiporter transmembrane domain-containing protein n=2 Tax=Pyrococcus horikoshii TaxID=53953 RepID=O58675_PYRHO|nr:monovalent cation/H+ antiporter subunit D family protein [Pyrococcus horikoshii]BAA30038.1 481aa long hypothetical protein [Pyrococcus horikoshii OT3]HII61208.1 monovalent cation/H+ antiporter subunit D family protein [Pyrococcus horikoshii]
MNAIVMVLGPVIFSILVYIFGTFRIEGTFRAKFRLPLAQEVKILYFIGIFLPMLLLPFVQGGVVGNYPRELGIEVNLDFISMTFILAEFIVFGTSSLYLLPRATNWKELSLLLLMHAGLIGAFISKDYFNFYIFMELSSVSSYALIASKDKKAAFNYLILSMTASYIFILALGMIYFQTGYLNVELASRVGLRDDTPLRLAAVALMLKAGIFPLHMWLPDAHSNAKTYVSSILSGIVVKAPIYGLILLSRLGNFEFLKPFAYLSMIFGVLMAILQFNAKRLLAYHTVSQMGYILLGVSTSNITGATLYSLAHAIFKSGLFLGVGGIVDTRRRMELNKLGSKNSLLLISILMLSLAISGLGVTIGGVGKAQLVTSKLDKIIIYAVSFGTAFSFSKLNYYLWKGHGNEPSNYSVLPSLISGTLAFILGFMLGGKLSTYDSLILLAALSFYAVRNHLVKRDYLIKVNLNESAALFALILGVVSI